MNPAVDINATDARMTTPLHWYVFAHTLLLL
jgi:hypothetical protein